MKISPFLLAFLLSVPSWAVTGSRNFEVQNAQFDPLHNLSASSSARMIVDYDHAHVILMVARPMPVCPEGKFCAQMMPAPFVTELPIVDIKTDQCGLRQVTAEQDERPLDGSFERIDLSDASDVVCRYLHLAAEKATYQTEYFSDTQNKEIKTWSTMNLRFVSRGEEEMASSNLK
jgi:hypothetical protein